MTEETRSSFIHATSPDNELRNESVFPAIEGSDFQDNRTFFTCHPVSSHLKKIKEKAKNTSGAETEPAFLVSRNSARNEIKVSVGPSQEDMSFAIQLTDGSKLCQQKESITTDSRSLQFILSSFEKTQESSLNASKLVKLQEKGMVMTEDSEEVSGVSRSQQSSREQEQKGGLTKVDWNDRSCREACIKGKKEESNLVLELNKNTTNSEKKSDFLYVSLYDDLKKFCCPDPEGELFVDKDSDNVPKIQKDQSSLLDVNKGVLVKDQVEAHNRTKNTQEEIENQTEQSLMEHETTSALDNRLVETERSKEADSFPVHKTDVGLAMQLENNHNRINKGPEKSKQSEESGDRGVPAGSLALGLESTSGKHGFGYHF